MSAIFFDAVEVDYPVVKLHNNSAVPGTIQIQIDGQYKGYAVGDVVTYKKGAESLTGSIWYILQGAISSTWPNGYYLLYVKHPDWQKFNGYTGGVVSPGNAVPSAIEVPQITVDKTIPLQSQVPIVSAATLLEEQRANDVIIKEDGTKVGSGEITTTKDLQTPIKEATELPFGLTKQKAIIFGAIGIAGLIILRKLFK